MVRPRFFNIKKLSRRIPLNDAQLYYLLLRIDILASITFSQSKLIIV
ncbi:hypothetical protein STRINF_01028 [Streptococcus infantarius subsp. infantarius ATCC BAA-102]|uniref:Uncharacterized protein n=1 Tax=Streptococcus infantarius subsp. infantarius ATCC BAA-102 TaxID=471872 RepID=A0ABM9XEG3_9STRE|nr:hypothetical protein STRINF_01028 [Streptococcus infantarius subsp. infantarius ATCC BAA-102]